MSWTTEQAQAIALTDTNILVSASAGSGKTAVLVARILNLMLTENLPLERFLVVTFTNAAAQEMRERIAQQLVVSKKANPMQRVFISEQIQRIQQAQISTLHSFCKDVIQKHFYVLDVDPNFKIATQQTLELKQQEALEAVFEKAYDEENEAFKALLAIYASHRGDGALKETLLRIYDFSRAHPYPDQWLEGCVAAYETCDQTFEATPLMADIKAYIVKWAGALAQQLEEAIEICGGPDGPVDYIETFNSDLAGFEGLLNLRVDDGYQQFEKAASAVTFDRLKTIKKANKDLVDQEICDQVKVMRDKVKKDFGKLKDSYFAQSFEAYLSDLKDMGPHLFALVALVHEFEAQYSQLKREDNLLDFNDLEQYAIKALSNPDVAASYQRRFKYVFIDEYQDANRVQEEIARLVKGDDNLFLVGDVKQSIYRFRMAEPALFLEKFYGYPKSEKATRIDLNRNFRTHPDVLEGVNRVFDTLMTTDFGGLDYVADGRLVPGREDFQNRAKPHLTLVCPESPKDDATTLEAQGIAHRVTALLNTTFYDTHQGCERHYQLSDIVILMRSIKGRSQALRDYLNTKGYPVLIDEEDSYFEIVEVATVINCLRIVDNMFQDVPLLGVMRSAIGGFTDVALATIRQYHPHSFYQALMGFSQIQLEGDTDAKEDLRALQMQVHSFLDMMARLRARRHLSASDFLWYVLEETGYWYFVSGLEDGRFRKQHLEVLVDKASQFEAQRQSGLHHFVDYLDQLQHAKVAYGGKANEKQQGNAIRVMSIHKSKGLEFPVVILAGTSKQFNMLDLRERIVFHQKTGMTTKWLDAKLRLQRDTLPYAHLKHILREESVAEEARILYVALTRAVHRLEVIGVVKDVDKQFVTWQGAPTAYNLSQQNSYLNWLMPVLMAGGHVPKDAGSWCDSSSNRERLEDKSPATLENASGQWTHTLFVAGQAQATKAAEFGVFGQALKSRIAQAIPTAWSIAPLEEDPLPAKLSVTELKSQETPGIYTPRITVLSSDFEESDMALTKGNAYHAFVEHMPLDLTPAQGVMDALEEKGLLTAAEKALIDIQKMDTLRSSQWYGRMVAATRVWKEQPFVFRKEFEDGSQTLVQGIIDALFLEDDHLILVDYKSDRLSHAGAFKDRYQQQLELYKDAAQVLLKLPVTKMLIYAFELGEWVEIQ